MPTSSYDLIVVGDDLAGLVAGALCARRGMRVLALGTGLRHGYQLGPYRLPIEPLSLAGLASPPVRRVLDELGLSHALKRKLGRAAVGFQLVAPDARLDVTEGDEALRSELLRELPGAADAAAACARARELAEPIGQLLGQPAEFPPTGFWKRRELGKAAPHLVEDAAAWLDGIGDPLVGALVRLPAVSGTRTAASALSAPAVARAFHTYRQGAPRLHGDHAALRELLADKLVKASGEARVARVAELTFGWGKATGVRLESGEELGATHVIAAMPADQLVELVGVKRSKRLVQHAEAMVVAGYRYTLNLVVNEAGIPEGMQSPVLIVADPGAPLVGDNAVALHLDEPDDEARVVVTATAVCPAPAAGESLEDAFADLRVRLRARIEMVMPFFSGHVLCAHSPHEAAPPEGARHEVGRGFPVPALPVWDVEPDAALGISAMPYHVGIKNVTVASAQVLPQLGFEGELAAGWYAARLACDASGRKRDYLKDEVISQ